MRLQDVDISADYAADVYRLYRAGVLTGSNNAHDFKPNINIRRSEVAGYRHRMAKPDLRQSFTIEAHVGMTADEVFSARVPRRTFQAVRLRLQEQHPRHRQRRWCSAHAAMR